MQVNVTLLFFRVALVLAVVVRFVFSGGSEIIKKSNYTSNSELKVPFLS